MKGLVAWYVDTLPFDAGAWGGQGTLDAAVRDLEAVANVQRAEPTMLILAELNTSKPTGPVPIYLVRPTFDGVAERLGVEWSTGPRSGEILVHDSLRTEWTVGDPVTLRREVPIYDANGTLLGSTNFTSTFTLAGFYSTPRPERVFPPEATFLSSTDVARLRSDLNMTGFELIAQVLIWLDRGALIDPFDLSGSYERLQRQRILLENAALPHGFIISEVHTQGTSLFELPRTVDSRTFFLRLFFIAFAVPMIVLAVLLTKVGFEIGLAGRRRELAVLRARGASSRGVLAFLLLGATFVAVLGALLGLGLGIVLSRLFMGAAAAGVAAPIPLGDVNLTTGSVVLGFAFAWMFAVGASWRSSKLAASEDIVGAMKAHHAEEVSIPHRASRDLLLASVAAVGLLLLLASSSVKGSPFSVLTFFLGLSTALLAPAAPILLTVAVARYLTRGTTRVYRSLSRLLRRALGALQPLVEKNLARAPRRASNTAMIVTFAVGFAVAVVIIAASYDAFREQEILRWSPSDIVVESRFVGVSDDPFNETRLAAVSAIPGVAAVTPVAVGTSDRGRVVAFEASSYLGAVPWLTASHLGGVDPAALMRTLDGGDVFAANPAFAGRYGVQPGDSVYFRGAFLVDLALRLTVVVPALPGLYPFTPDDPGELVYVDVSVLPATANLSFAESWRYLIGLEPGASSQAVASELSDMLAGDVWVRTLEDARSAAAGSPFSVATFRFLEAQIQLAIAMLVVAIGLFVYSAAAERREELATLVARGFGPRTIRKLLMAEGWVVTLLGLAVGAVGGLVTAAAFVALGSLLTPVPVPLVVPAIVVVPLLGAAVGVLAASYLGAASIQGMDVARVLKLRGG